MTTEGGIKRPRLDGKKWGFGIVGCGMGAFTHAANFLEMDRAAPIACYGRDPAKAEAFREKWKMKKAYSDYDAFLADPEIEVIVIVVPNGLHRDFSVKAANAGKHIVLEKPFDITLGKAIEQIKACEANNVKLSGIYQMRFCKCAEKIKKAIDEGKFGDLIHIDIVDKEYRDEQSVLSIPLENWPSLVNQHAHVAGTMVGLESKILLIFGRERRLSQAEVA